MNIGSEGARLRTTATIRNRGEIVSPRKSIRNINSRLWGIGHLPVMKVVLQPAGS
jgi:hypothetical protein